MELTIDDRTVHISTGGVDPTGDGPAVVLIHGAGMDATVWQLQTRFLAHRGYRTVAVDLPGHGHSDGPALETIGEMADWLGRFLDAAGLAPAHLVGHSMGTFVALELAARRPASVSSLILAGTADAMPVHPDLLTAADDDVPLAASLMAAWGHAKPAHVGGHANPGLWMLGGARALIENAAPGVLRTGLAACAAYGGAAAAAAGVACPVTLIVGRGDRMTTPRAAGRLAEGLHEPTVIETPAGHMMMTEDPAGFRRALLDALPPLS